MLMFDVPGLAHSRHTGQDLTMFEILSMVVSETPTFSKNCFMVSSEACHHRICSFLRTSRMALSLSVRNKRIDLPTLKSNQLLGF